MKSGLSILLLLGALVLCAVFLGGKDWHAVSEEPATPVNKEPAPMPNPAPSTGPTYRKPSDEEIKRKLTAVQFKVTQQDATEPAFQNEFWNNHEAGLYVDVVTGEPLFSSKDKFDSGTGWPSFTKAVEEGRVVSKVDRSYGMARTEVRSNAGSSHLGHVFEDGPKPTGMRYCINSASLRFIPVEKLEAEGYGKFRAQILGEAQATNDPTAKNACAVPLPGQKAGCSATLESVVLAGGCFWGMQDLLRKIPGVLETEVGYSGGTTEKPDYKQVKTGTTGHAEAVKITFDPSKITFGELLEKWFFKMHDPTTKDRQGNDRGTQYRSAIFYSSEIQKQAAEEVIKRVNASGKWKDPIATQVAPAGTFTRAEDYHQDYLKKDPNGYTCHYMRE